MLLICYNYYISKERAAPKNSQKDLNMISYKIENFKVLDEVVYIYYTDEQGLKRVWLTDREIAWRFKWKRSMVMDRILQHIGEYCIIWKEI